MHNLVPLEALWKRAVRQAVQRFDITGDATAVALASRLHGSACPFTLGEMVGDNFRISQALQRLTALADAATG